MNLCSKTYIYSRCTISVALESKWITFIYKCIDGGNAGSCLYEETMVSGDQQVPLCVTLTLTPVNIQMQ